MFDVEKEHGLTLREIGEGVGVEEVRAATGCTFKVAEDLQPMKQV